MLCGFECLPASKQFEKDFFSSKQQPGHYADTEGAHAAQLEIWRSAGNVYENSNYLRANQQQSKRQFGQSRTWRRSQLQGSSDLERKRLATEIKRSAADNGNAVPICKLNHLGLLHNQTATSFKREHSRFDRYHGLDRS